MHVVTYYLTGPTHKGPLLVAVPVSSGGGSQEARSALMTEAGAGEGAKLFLCFL